MRCPEIEACFENLGPADYDRNRVSPPTVDYNCIAYAVGETDKRWWPSIRWKGDYYWPPHLPREKPLEETLENFVRAFETKRYRVCKTAKPKKGIEKVAIYAGPAGNPLHAARQLESGMWTSKCGDLEDIEHKTIASMEGKHYGKVAIFLERKRNGKTFLTDRVSEAFAKFCRVVRRAF